MKRLNACGLAVAGLVCLAATVPAASLTIAPITTGHIEDGLHASSSVAMDAGWHASPGEDKHSALLRFDLSAYSNWQVDGPGTLCVYSREKQPNAVTFNLYKLRQSADDWDGDSMGGPSTPDWDTIGATERQNAIDDGSIGSGDFGSTGLVQVSVSQAAIETMILNGTADSGVMLDNGNTQENSRVYLNGINWATTNERPYLQFRALLHPQTNCSPGAGQLDKNLQVVDLRDLDGDLPLNILSTTQILWQSEGWEHDTLGFTTVVKNDRGLNPDNRYYLYYAHHDPTSGIGVAVADSLTGPYTKISPPDSRVLTPSGGSANQHYSTPKVVWNEDANLWHMYFHFWNSDHFPWRNTMGMGFGHQMTALATTPDLSSHNWTPLPGDPAVLNPPIEPVLPSTAERWINSQSSYHGVQRLPDGTWVAFMRGTGGEYDGANWLQDTTKIGIAISNDGINWTYLPQNPILHEGDGGGGPPGDYTAEFIGYLGENASGVDEYLLVWNEAGQIRYGKTTDFVNIERDPRGYANWPSYGGADTACREGDRLYIFTGKFIHEMVLPLQDQDGDGMNDDWEEQYFGSTTNSSGGADEDWDNDGSRDLDEYEAGTDPTNPNSLLVIRDARAESTSQFVLKWLSVPTKCYSIFQSPDPTGPWSLSASNLVATPPLNVHTIDVNSAREFFKIGLEN